MIGDIVSFFKMCKGCGMCHFSFVWITRSGKCLLANNASKIPDRVLRDLMAVIEARSGEVVKKWYKFHKEISYYC